MQKAFEKIKERLDKASDYYECDEQGREHVQMVELSDAIEIVNQVAEEYKSTEHINCSSDSSTVEVCEWIVDGSRYTTCSGNDFIQADPVDWDFCPYCGKKIKVI